MARSRASAAASSPVDARAAAALLSPRAPSAAARGLRRAHAEHRIGVEAVVPHQPAIQPRQADSVSASVRGERPFACSSATKRRTCAASQRLRAALPLEKSSSRSSACAVVARAWPGKAGAGASARRGTPSGSEPALSRTPRRAQLADAPQVQRAHLGEEALRVLAAQREQAEDARSGRAAPARSSARARRPRRTRGGTGCRGRAALRRAHRLGVAALRLVDRAAPRRSPAGTLLPQTRSATCGTAKSSRRWK